LAIMSPMRSHALADRGRSSFAAFGFLTAYLCINVVLGHSAWDPYPFILLNLFLFHARRDSGADHHDESKSTAIFLRAVMALAAKLKTVTDFTALLLSQFAAVGAGLPSGQRAFRSVMLMSKASMRYAFSNPARDALGWAGPTNCQPSSLA
jgi:hypothetical protein